LYIQFNRGVKFMTHKNTVLKHIELGNNLKIDKYNFLYRSIRIYLATPYSVGGINTSDIKQFNFEHVSKVAGKLMDMGYVVYSPVSQNHPISIYGNLKDRDLDFWLIQDLPFIEFCDVLCILMLPGWNISPGVKKEIEYATELGKDIYYINYKNNELTFFQYEAIDL